MIEGKTIFITGGAGFIGSTLVGRLVDQNKIVVYDNLARNSLKDKVFKDHPNLRLVEGDVLNFERVAEAMKGADIIVHCATIAGIDTVIKSPVTTMRVNMVGSANVLQAAAQLSRCEVTPESLLLVDVGVLTSGVVARKGLLYEVALFDESIRRGHDFDLWLRLAQKKARFACNKKVLLSYTVLGQGLSGNAISQHERRLELLDTIQARGGLSASEESALKRNFDDNTARLALERGRAKLLAEDFAGALDYFNQSQKLRTNWKLALIGVWLRVAPRMFARFYRLRSPATS